MNLTSVKYQIAKKVDTQLTSMIKEDAAQAGWPSEAVTQLSWAEQDYDANSSEINAQIEDLEYGTPNSSPNSIKRNFTSKNESKINTILDDSFISALGTLGAFS